ncbi:hypothetical protein [Burkholderia sp. MS455]|uniref:esterase/lipase family protein n=1 Tax=Burkholderia sp. MS455 TaxID=2811788 RepID=UPI001EF51C84|nr:hypothetical protein [Burkholderia sp. MS455]
MIENLEENGFAADRLFVWEYDTSQSTNEVLAGQFSRYVESVIQKTGAFQINVVAHSLGSLPTRWYIKFGNGVGSVRNWISIAGPNHGTQAAWLCALWDQGCRDMTPGSYVISHLNQEPPTPGPTQYWTFWSSCDEQIAPPSSTALSGGINTQTACLKHNDLLTNRDVLDQVQSILKTY